MRALLIVALLLPFAAIAAAPIVALSYFLAPDRKTAIRNMALSMIPTFVGMLVGVRIYWAASGTTPPGLAYAIVGAWIGGCTGIIVFTVVRYLLKPGDFQLRRSIRSVLLAITAFCVALALIATVWNLDWSA